MALNDYTYKAINDKGETIEAAIKAASIDDASHLLQQRKLYPFSIAPLKRSLFNYQDLEKKIQRIKTSDRVIFTRQLATLIKAGLPIAGAMRLLVDQMENPKMKDLVLELSISIEAGNSLSESLSLYKTVFSKVYINVIAAGEISGNLDEVLIKLADQEEKTAEVNRKIRGALTYPFVILAVIMLVAGLMVSVVLPEVGKIYEELNRETPTQTKLLLGAADGFKKYWYLFIIGFIGLIAATRTYLRTPTGRRKWDKIKLNIPGFKTLIRKIYMTRFTSTLSSLVNSGVPMLKGLEITANSINNVHLEESIKTVAQRVKSGAPLSKPIEEDDNFLPLVGKMIAVGEQTGSIGNSLEKVSNYYEDEVDQAVENLSSLIEPLTMVVLGGMIAFLVAAVLLPIYGIVNAS